MAKNLNHRSEYAAKENYKLVDEFNSAYWSGCDLQVYAGNVWLGDSVQVNYQVVENTRPYWHYSHYVPTRIWHGTRMLQGELTVNFTRDAFLFGLLEKLSRVGIATPEQESAVNLNQADGTQTGSPVLYNVYPWGPQTGRKIMTDEMTADQRREFVLARKKAVDQQTLKLSQSRPSIPQDRGLFETLPSGWDLNLIFGAYLSRPLTLTFNSAEDQYYLNGATYQDLRPNPAPLGTGIKLVGVEIQGLARSISDDGRPIMETYTFVARDVRILVPQDIADFPDYATLYSQTAETYLGPTATLKEVQELLKGLQ